MTVDELLAREAIRATMADYTMAGDRLRIDDFVACFTADGVIEAEGAPGEYLFRYEGQAAIRAWQSRWRDRAPGEAAVHGARFVRHHLSTCQIELIDAARARARTYWVAWTDIGPDHAGHYLDDFRRVDDVWRIARRRVRADWYAPGSLFAGAVKNTAE